MNLFLSNLLLLLNLTYFAISLLKVNIKIILAMILSGILGIIMLTYINYTSLSLFGTLIMTFFYVIYIFVFYKGSSYRKLLVIILFILTISFSELFIANIMNYIFNLSANQIDTNIYTIALILSNGLTFVILSIILKFFEKDIKDIMDRYSKFMWFSLILPMTTLLFLYNFTDYFSTFRDNIMTLIIIFGLIISNIISLLTISREFKRLELNNEIKETKMKYNLLNTQYNTNYYFLHDTIRKLTKLDNHINESNFKDFQKEIMELNNNLIKSFNTISSNSDLLNSVLNFNISEIIKYNINVKTVIETNHFEFITLEDQQHLYSDLLTLSIHSCINTKDINPRIIIKTKQIDKQIIIQCSFSYTETHSICLINLYTIVQKYNGRISEKVNKNNGLLYYDIFIVFFDFNDRY